MNNLRVIDQIGNRRDYEAAVVPRIGERIVVDFGVGQEPVRLHYYRVQDVMYRLDAKIDHQIALLVDEEESPVEWPS